MRIKTDENVHPEAAEFLRKQGHDVRSVWDEGLRGADDGTIAAVCRAEARALISLDLDFADIRTYPPDDYHGVLILRLASQSRIGVLRALNRVLPFLNETNLRGKLWILDEHDLRVHGDEASAGQ